MFLFKVTLDDSRFEFFLVNSNPTYLCSVFTQWVVTLGRMSATDLISSVHNSFDFKLPSIRNRFRNIGNSWSFPFEKIRRTIQFDS